MVLAVGEAAAVRQQVVKFQRPVGMLGEALMEHETFFLETRQTKLIDVTKIS